MISEETRLVIEQSKRIFDLHRQEWVATRSGQFVAIEPDSGEWFFAESFDAAVRAARTKYPDRLSHTLRIGHEAVFFIGQMGS
ncbi:MAG: hypothetical protein C0478_14360 [Planctomyces sp.]|jgi:hypothetical protein|nr:hypothetical protein [Planctomyces sp.]